MSSLIERLIQPEVFGGKNSPENIHVRDLGFDAHFRALFGNLPPGAQPYLLRVMSISKIVIDEMKLGELRVLAMKFHLMDAMGSRKFSQLGNRKINSILAKVNEQNQGRSHKGQMVQKHHIVSRSLARIKYHHSDNWINEDFNISNIQSRPHAAIHGVIENMSLEDADIFLQIFNQPRMIWTREALMRAREAAVIQGKARREYIALINRKKAEAGMKKSQKKNGNR